MKVDGIKNRGEGYRKFEWACAAHFWKPLHYFRPKYVIFRTFFHLTQKSIPCFFLCFVVDDVFLLLLLFP